MKIAILTITDGANYGNRLQNYAMQELLKEFDPEVVTLKRRTFRDESFFKKAFIQAKNIAKFILGKKNTNFCACLRKIKFDKFNKKYIKLSKYILENNKAPNDLNDKFDFFVCGSDQIWNTRFDIVKCDIANHLAAFADKNKRIAFAASFGTNDIEKDFCAMFSNELKKFKSIGVRETSGANIVKKYTARNDAQVVLDPTLMIAASKWEQIQKKPSYISGPKFIITYFLGGRTEKINNHIRKVANHFNAEIISLDREFLIDSEIVNKKHFQTSPDEFVWLINNAICVLTDSFHAAAFSIIFHKPFCVYERTAYEENNNMGSRIDTLLKTFNLTSCSDNIDDPIKIPEEYSSDMVDEFLILQKKQSLDFLKKALND